MKVTTLMLSCGRGDLLVQSFSSFLQTYNGSNHYIIVDDSGNKQQQHFIKQWYPTFDKHFTHVGQAGALDLLIEKALHEDSDYYILLEDDWKFTKPGWFEDSIRVLEQYPEVMLIGCSLTDTMRPYMGELQQLPIKVNASGGDVTVNYSIPIHWHNPWRLDEKHGYWHGWCSSPRVMRRSDVELLPKFSNYTAEEIFDQQWWKYQYEHGRRSIWLGTTYCEHIGWGRSQFIQGDMLDPNIRTWLKVHV